MISFKRYNLQEMFTSPVIWKLQKIVKGKELDGYGVDLDDVNLTLYVYTFILNDYTVIVDLQQSGTNLQIDFRTQIEDDEEHKVYSDGKHNMFSNNIIQLFSTILDIIKHHIKKVLTKNISIGASSLERAQFYKKIVIYITKNRYIKVLRDKNYIDGSRWRIDYEYRH